MSSRGLLLAVIVALGAAAGGLTWYRAEGSAPGITAPESVLVGKQGARFAIAISDDRAGPREVSVTLVTAAGQRPLATAQYPGSFMAGGALNRPEQVEVALDPAALSLRSGSAVVRVVARDWSWRDNEAVLEIPITVDLDPPRLSVSTGLSYVRRGGAGAVAYSVSEPTVVDGVRVGRAEQDGSTFYSGHQSSGAAGRPAGDRVAVYAVPTDAPVDPEIRIVAEDAAGNRAEARWPIFVNERSQPDERIDLPKRFLEGRVEPLAGAARIPTDDLVKAFQAVNQDLRAKNEKRIREIVAQPSPTRLFEGAFGQLANSKVTSRFAERRSYYYEGKRVSNAVHYGYDLASTQAAPISASNAGRVVFADELGIYGQCVLVDHGLGVTSLYGHLSRLDVAAGDEVGKGDLLGLSGATGLAGGDHLHFAILVGGTYVDPIEWWDPKWVEINIAARLPTSGR